MKCPYWVIENRLAGSCAPESVGSIMNWAKMGIRAVVSLIERQEFEELGISYMDYINTLNELGMELLHAPTRDGYAPDTATLMSILMWMDSRINSGKPTLVHCKAGVGRSPTVIIGYLMFKGYSMGEAFKRLLMVNPEVRLSYQQVRVLEELNAIIAKRRHNA